LATANSRNFRSLALPRKNSSISWGSEQRSHSSGVMASPSRAGGVSAPPGRRATRAGVLEHQRVGIDLCAVAALAEGDPPQALVVGALEAAVEHQRVALGVLEHQRVGIDLCARLREIHPGTPVIVCTGEATPEEAAELLRLGARRYLQKPVSPDELLATVEASLP
jgi:CheY-like chemotaxis protein